MHKDCICKNFSSVKIKYTQRINPSSTNICDARKVEKWRCPTRLFFFDFQRWGQDNTPPDLRVTLRNGFSTTDIPPADVLTISSRICASTSVPSSREAEGRRPFVIASLENVPTRRKIDATKETIPLRRHIVSARLKRAYTHIRGVMSRRRRRRLRRKKSEGKDEQLRRGKQQESFRWPFKARTFRSVTVFRVHRRATPQGGHLRAGVVVSLPSRLHCLINGRRFSW